MPSTQECVAVVEELAFALSPHALNKLLGPGLVSASPADQMKFRQVLAYGVQDEADLPFQSAVEEFMGTRIIKSVMDTLEDLGFTMEQIKDMDAPEFQQLLEEVWIPELERIDTP